MIIMRGLVPFRRSFATSERLRSIVDADNNKEWPIGKRSIPAIFARGGTSNGLVIWSKDLPPKRLCMQHIVHTLHSEGDSRCVQGS